MSLIARSLYAYRFLEVVNRVCLVQTVCCLSNSSPASSQTSSSAKDSFRSCDFEVFGKVQGVYFRKYTQHQAKNLNLVGWVQNTVRDTVEGYMEGEKTNIDQMKEWLQKTGSPSSKVTKRFVLPKPFSDLMVYLSTIRRAIQLRSRMFIPTPVHLPRETRSKSQLLLQEASIVHSVEHGFPQLLPLGFRVLTKLQMLIRNEMNQIGGQELSLPAIGRKNIWEISDRWNLMHNELFKFKDHEEEYCLSPTHEEAITKLVSLVCKTTPRSNYPLLLYQITWKYRNEDNYRHGLLRTKEFLMKDMYSFHRDEECARQVYDQVCDAYSRIFQKLELNCYKVPADSGLMGGSLNHEFLAASTVGEDSLIICSECNRGYLKTKPQCEHSTKIEQRAIELGHSFLLGDRYTKAFNATAGSSDLPEDKKLLIMGCYGIGLTRLMAATVEILTPKDSFNIRWPRRIVPYQVAILPPRRGSAEEKQGNENTLDQLLKLDHSEWFVDDRTELTIGYRLKDCQKLGIPIVIAFGKRATKDKLCEVIDVYNNRTEYLSYEETMKFIANYYSLFC